MLPDNNFSGVPSANIEQAINGVSVALQAVNSNVATHPYKFNVYRVAAYTTAAAAFTKMPLDTQDFDPNSNYDRTTNYRYTAPVSGYYYLGGEMNYNAVIGNSLVTIYKNGVEHTRGNQNTVVNNLGTTVSAVIYLSAGDYVELWYYTQTAVLLNAASIGARFFGHLLSRDGPALASTTLVNTLFTEVARQNDTTNSALTSARFESGYGILVPGVSPAANEAVTFRTAFSSPPIVLITSGGDHASSTTYGSGSAIFKFFLTEAGLVTVSGFQAFVRTSDGTNWAAGNTVFYHWLAIGQ